MCLRSTRKWSLNSMMKDDDIIIAVNVCEGKENQNSLDYCVSIALPILFQSLGLTTWDAKKVGSKSG